MPYTAPWKTSPSAQPIEPSDLTTPPSPSSPAVVNPHPCSLNLPRAYSSASYVRRHRRCSSTSKQFVFPAPEGHLPDAYASVRQSPPPVSEGPIPPGALLSPPESLQNSSDDESSPHRSREELRLAELEAAVRSIEQRRMSSPERQSSGDKPSTSREDAVGPNAGRQSRPTLTKDNRNISHSRSFAQEEEALTSSPEESERDDEPPRPKHEMVRKKSGELVRPALRPPSARRRPSSMPGTPTFSKAVHFDSQLEHIRHFLQLDKPQAVSAGSSPVEDLNADGEYPFGTESSSAPAFEWELHLTNFPQHSSHHAHHRVRLEQLYLSPDKSSLVGNVVVANLAYHKHVAARFTFDNWKTTSEVTAEYNRDRGRKHAPKDGYDHFSFNIKLDEQTNLEKKTMFVCVRYNANGQEFWDNNRTRNYQVNFSKVPKPRPSRNLGIPAGARPRVNLPRSRSFTGSAGTRPHSMPSSLKDFSDMHRYISFGPPPRDQRGTPGDDNDIPHDTETPLPIRRDKPPHQVFGNRYDFESSLSAVMRTKPEYDRTMLSVRAATSEAPAIHLDNQKLARGATWRANAIAAQPRSSSEPAAHEMPSSLLSSKPHRESSVYKELVDRYCFFGSPASAPNLNRPLKSTDSGLPKSSTQSSNSPSPPSPGNVPPTLEYKYFEPMQDSFLKETQTPAAIRG
ncbi:hypothetical protein P175DRAFT_0497686 [Aspergillus ochraceoroseus IBT 24754]|uniref:CBM21 domain-containing protein n=2 Tax=Aspergillus ochraceoroseus TaxID=138278 RepID=A0A2T5M7Q7_9EURO|nr:uncharacterized protein P175DRAFT_0497686 [Aspergillus ochraceoroseus IBT 24754]KKK19744.1 hypothetical protein AOCH_006129 [Aspergillus ochraceoroseus]PTU24568.1 hypothetical protein P175DRAFT_0497686 [Aspergillus ochraceoroseus IBT 24754]